MAINNVYGNSPYVNALKVLQEGGIEEWLHNEESFFKMITAKFNKKDLQGKKIILAAKEALGHPAVGFVAYNGNFKTVKRVSYENLELEPKYLTAHLEVDRVENELAKTDLGSYVRLWGDEIASKNQAMAQQLSRSIFGDGSGVLGTFASETTDAVPTPDRGIIQLSTASSAKGFIGWLEKDDEVKIVDPATGNSRTLGAAATKARVFDIDLDNSKATLIAIDNTGAEVNWSTVGVTAGDYIVREGVTFTSSATVVDSASEELVGFDGIVDDATTTLFGVNRANVPIFKGQVKDMSGALLGTDALHSLAKKIGLQAGKPKIIICSYDSYIRLAEIGESMRSVITSPSTDVTLGIETIKYVSPTGGAIPIVNCRYCPTNKLYMLDTDTFEFRGKEPEFVTINGEVERLQAASGGGYTNKVTAELFGMMAVLCKNPSKNGKLENFSNIDVTP